MYVTYPSTIGASRTLAYQYGTCMSQQIALRARNAICTRHAAPQVMEAGQTITYHEIGVMFLALLLWQFWQRYVSSRLPVGCLMTVS